MNKLKDTLYLHLGQFGYILFYVICALFAFAPLVCVLDFNPIVNFLIVGVIMFVPILGQILELVLWVWSFVLALNMPCDVFLVIYYIAFTIIALKVLFSIVVFILSLFSKE